jgi:hypothetical protein
VKVGYSYSWLLPASDLARIQEVIGTLRHRAIDLGGEVGDVRVLTGDEAQAVQQDAKVAVLFTATLPGATEGQYGLAAAGISSGPQSWSWHGAVVVSDVRIVSQLHAAAAALGLEVVEGYAGMVFESKKDNHGVVQVEQRQAFDWTDF